MRRQFGFLIDFLQKAGNAPASRGVGLFFAFDSATNSANGPARQFRESDSGPDIQMVGIFATISS
jgi:hypothetical protein